MGKLRKFLRGVTAILLDGIGGGSCGKGGIG